MARFRMQVDLKTDKGTSSSNQELELPDSISQKIGNSNFKNEVITSIESALPNLIGGADWRKNGWRVESFNCVVKL
jgi:hypothetical protein